MTAESEQRLQEILRAYVQAVDAGQAPDQRQLLRMNPDLTARLASYFSDHEKLDLIGRVVRAEAQAAAEKRSADKARASIEMLEYVQRISRAQREWQEGNLVHASELLDACPPPLRGWEHDYLYTLFNGDHRTFRGPHCDGSSVAISPDGKRIVSSGQIAGDDFHCREYLLESWDVETGKTVITHQGHTAKVTCVAYSPDGQRIVSGSLDMTLRVWDAQTGREIWKLEGHVGPVLSVAISPDGKWIVSGSGEAGDLDHGSGVTDNTARVWESHTGKQARALKGHGRPVTSVAFSPDGQWIVSGSEDRTSKVWDARTGREIRSLRGHSGGVTSVAFSPDGERIVSGSLDKTVKLWDAQTGQETGSLLGHTGPIASVAFCPDGRRIVTGSADRSLKVWDAETKRDICTLKGHTDRVTGVAISSDSRCIASVSQDMTLKVWDVLMGRETRNLRGWEHGVCSQLFTGV